MNEVVRNQDSTSKIKLVRALREHLNLDLQSAMQVTASLEEGSGKVEVVGLPKGKVTHEVYNNIHHGTQRGKIFTLINKQTGDEIDFVCVSSEQCNALFDVVFNRE